MMPGVVKPITPTFTGTVTLLPSGAVAVNCLVTMVYGATSGLPLLRLCTLATTIGKLGPAHFLLPSTPSTSRPPPSTWLRKSRP
ncbi:hypothetical protein D3C71_575980 [compost metagenome]